MNRAELLEARRDRELFGNAFYLRTPAGLKRLDPIRVRVEESFVDYKVDARAICRIPRRNVLHRRFTVSRFRHTWRLKLPFASFTITARRHR